MVSIMGNLGEGNLEGKKEKIMETLKDAIKNIKDKKTKTYSQT